METFLRLDNTMMTWFSQSVKVDLLDKLLPYLTNPYILLGLLVLFFLYLCKDDAKQATAFFISLLILIIISEGVTTFLLAPFFARPAPCISLTDLDFPIACSGSFSFPSHIAADSFAALIAIFLFYYRYWLIAFVAVLLSNWSTVYVGYFYPGDVIAGGILGLSIGFVCSTLIYTFIDERFLKEAKKDVY